jgi:hypothetical protein
MHGEPPAGAVRRGQFSRTEWEIAKCGQRAAARAHHDHPRTPLGTPGASQDGVPVSEKGFSSHHRSRPPLRQPPGGERKESPLLRMSHAGESGSGVESIAAACHISWNSGLFAVARRVRIRVP